MHESDIILLFEFMCILIGGVITLICIYYDKQKAKNSQMVKPFPPLKQADISALKRKEPRFSAVHFTRWTGELFRQLAIAYRVEELEPIRPCMTDEFYKSCRKRIVTLEKQGINEVYKRIMVRNAVITDCRVQEQQEQLIVTLQLTAICYKMDMKTNRIISGNANTTVHFQYELAFIRYHAQQKKAVPRAEYCPHCGAPIERKGQGQCDYCKSKLAVAVSGNRNRSWMLCCCAKIEW